MTQEKRSDTGRLEQEESRRAFLGKFASAVFAGLVFLLADRFLFAPKAAE